VGGAWAAAPEAPEVLVEGPAHATGVVVRGVLSPAAVGPVEAGVYEFVFRKGASCEGVGQKTAPVPAGVMNGSEHEEVLETLSGLVSGSEYTVCLRAENGAGEATVGAGVSFVTAIAPEVPETLAVEAVTAAGAKLRGVLNPGATGNPGVFEFVFRASATECEEGGATGPVATAGAKEEAVSFSETKLQPATQYTVCVLARNEVGEEAVGAPVTFTTLAAAPVVESESVSRVNATEATLEAAVNANNQKASVRFEYASEEAALGTAGATTLSAGELAGVFGGQVAAAGTGGGALEAGKTYFYRVIAENQQSRNESKPVVGAIQSFKTAVPPETPETLPASAVTAVSAELHGVLNPKHEGNAGDYEFLYRQSATECEGEGATSAEAMSGSEGQAVEAGVSELLPNAIYSFCLVARNEAGETTQGPRVTFTTSPVKASLESEAAQNLASSSVDLTARINPNGTETTYRMEYGTSSSYGSSTPDVHLPAGRTSVSVSQPVTELHPDTTYHWRLVASNTAGLETSVDHTFIDETAGGLPDGRQYELVTPPQKDGALIGAVFGGAFAVPPAIARDGMDLVAVSIQCFANTPSCTAVRNPEGEPYEFARTPQGWVTHPLAAPLTKFGVSSLWTASAESHTALLSAPTPPSGGDAFYTSSGGGEPVEIGPLGEGREGTGGGSAFTKIEDLVATSDFSHVVYFGKRFWSLDGAPENGSSLYEYAGRSPHPLSVGVTGGQGSTSLIGGCGTYLGSAAQTHFKNATNAYGSLSESGRTVYFTVPGCGGEPEEASSLYARVDGESADAHTVSISTPVPSSCKSVECQTAPPHGGFFAGASSEGSRVFFTSTGQLTDNASQGTGQAGSECDKAGSAGCNLYESICTEPCGKPGEELIAKERQLIDISEGAKATGGPRVQGVMAISTDGTHVYFVAHGVLTETPNSQGQTALQGADNLYVHADGQPVKFIVSLPKADEEVFPEVGSEWTEGIELANVTPDGRFLVFLSHGALTPDDTRHLGPAQVYRYDAQTGALVRISIGEDGYNDNGNSGTGEAGITKAEVGDVLGVAPARGNPTMSNDGEYVFFESPVGLAPGALDDVHPVGEAALAENVYEYHNGSVSLISDGKDTTPTSAALNIVSSTRLLGSDETGSNVFFATNDPLTSQDTDTQRDYYDARICTQEEPCPHQPQEPTPCQEEGCHTPTTPPSPTPLTGSNTLQSNGNQPPQQEVPLAHATILTHATHATTKFTIHITLPLNGHITITSPNTLKTSRTLHAGTQTLTLTLTHTTHNQLHRKHKLTIKLHTTYTPTNTNTPTTTTTTITLKTGV
jgi:hypothetical protein